MSYSQRGQDLFVVDVLQFSKINSPLELGLLEHNVGEPDSSSFTTLNVVRNGTFLDFGCRGPIDINNTYLLEKEYNFSGLSFDIDSVEIDNWKDTDRKFTNAICSDLLELNIQDTLDHFYTSPIIDYFSFDLEPPLLTLEVLKKFPFDKYKFKVITFEHDFYRGFDTVKPSREIFLKYGYRKIKKTKMDDYDSDKKIYLSEDWWIHPELINVPDEWLDSVIEDLV